MDNKQRAYLRALANALDPIYQIGKNGVSENQIISIVDSLEAHELIKLKVLKNANEDIKDIANDISNRTQSEVVQIMGSIITLYKRSTKKPKIEL